MRGDADQVADVRNQRASIPLPINPFKAVKIKNTPFGRIENALGQTWSGSVLLRGVVPLWLFHAELKARWVKFNTNKLRAAKFCFVVHCDTGVTSKFLARYTSLKQ